MRRTRKGSFNFAGIKNPAVDALVERAIAAGDRQSLNIACRALDRVLRAEHYWVSAWYKPSHWIAYWDMFGRPATKPRYARGDTGNLVVRRREGGEGRTAGLT